MSPMDQDGVQLAARALLGGMKLPSPGLRTDLLGRIVCLALPRDRSVWATDWDVAVSGIHERRKSMFQGLSSDMTVQAVEEVSCEAKIIELTEPEVITSRH